MTPTFRYHPSVVAQAFATLAVMFPNRVVLGLGSGESLNDVPALGLMWPTFKERIARLLESITVMRRLWTQDRVTFEGQYYRTDKATLYDKPSTPVADLSSRVWTDRRENGWGTRGGLHLYEQESTGALQRNLPSERGGGIGGGRPQGGFHRSHD